MLFSDRNEWFEKANCRGYQTSTFFPEVARGQAARKFYKKAIAICEDCSVIKECLEFSLREHIVEFGVFGGKMPRARQIMLRERNKQRS